MRWEVSGRKAALKDIASSIFSKQHIAFLLFLLCFFAMCFVSVQLVHLYSTTDAATACFISSERSDDLMIDNLSIHKMTTVKQNIFFNIDRGD